MLQLVIPPVGVDHLSKSLLCRTVAYFFQNINDSEKNVFTNTSSGARGQGQEDRGQEGRVEAGQDLRRKVQGRHHRGRYPGTLRPGVSLTKLFCYPRPPGFFANTRSAL